MCLFVCLPDMVAHRIAYDDTFYISLVFHFVFSSCLYFLFVFLFWFKITLRYDIIAIPFHIIPQQFTLF